jgi:WD40 repeat protein
MIRSVSCLSWLPTLNYYGIVRGFLLEKIVCGTLDSKLLCLDARGMLFAATLIDSNVMSLDSDGRSIFGGCEDGSIRVWIMESSIIVEVFRCNKAHNTGTISSLVLVSSKSWNENSINSNSNKSKNQKSDAIISGCNNGSVRVWLVSY